MQSMEKKKTNPHKNSRKRGSCASRFEQCSGHSKRQQKGQCLLLGYSCWGPSQLRGDVRSHTNILILARGSGLHGCGSHDDKAYSTPSRDLPPEIFFSPFS